ncbi:MAG TPA: hypothetical protein VF581_12115 [Flavobacterium sp.]|jgi:hypothetical protein
MENYNNFDAAQFDANNENDWRQTATDGQWITPVSEDAMNFAADDDDEDEDEDADTDWGDVDPQPEGGNEPSGPGSAV